MSGDRDDVTDRLSRRFDDEGGGESGSEESQNATSAESAGDQMKTENDRPAASEVDPDDTDDRGDEKDVANVKEEWNGTTVYLPGDLNNDVGKVYKQLDLQLDDELTKFRKTRHFYPLLVNVGRERLESMDSNEIMERLEDIDPDLDTYRE